MSFDYTKMIEAALEAAQKSGAQNPVALKVGEAFGYADAFLILSGQVERNVQAIARDIEDELNLQGVKTLRREGREGGRWILLDFGDLIVHIFHAEDREYYALEKLWADQPEIDLSGYLTTA
ncbi:ribosome silencing factor [Canibacter zhuwentaonis]|uniref:ribosome silencing factor n=1 Tax=Canibacter zhuwentaonis TaxID=2837491 RepID=UPI0020290BA8|nr:ribosome silencing factor [Canibacter zhuwentaonis]